MKKNNLRKITACALRQGLFLALVACALIIAASGCDRGETGNTPSGNSSAPATGTPADDGRKSADETSPATDEPSATSTPVHTADATAGDVTALPSATPTAVSTAANTPASTAAATSAPTVQPTKAPTPKPTPTSAPTLPPQTPVPNLCPENPSAEHDGLIFSEAMSQNSAYAPQNGSYYDWVEFYNSSSQDVRLSDYTFSDDAGKPDAYSFPDEILAPGKYYVVYCSDLKGIANHAAFKISSSGETLCLYKGGETVDTLTVPGDLEKNTSFGRNGSALVYMQNPSPDAANFAGYAASGALPTASLKSGIYPSPISVNLSSSGKIYYTTDGTKPTTASPLYSGPIYVNETKSIRAIAVVGSVTTPEVDFTYVIDVAPTLPVVNVEISDSRFAEIRANVSSTAPNVEYESLITYMEDGEVKWSVPCGFRLHGNDSRRCDKQNFQIRFRSKYGLGKLHYKVFDDLDVDVFNSLLLKGGSEDWSRTMIRDEFITSLAGDYTSLYTQASKPVILYVAGEYWGIYFLRERFDDQYISSHLGVSEESVTMINSWVELESGTTMIDYYNLVDYLKTHDLTTDEAFSYIDAHIDLTNFIDWTIVRTYFGDHDYHNIRLFRSSEGDGKWRLMLYDLDWAMNEGSSYVTEKTFYGIMQSKVDPIVSRIIQNPTVKKLFLERFEELREGCISDAVVTARVNSFVTLMSPEIARDRAKWGFSEAYWRQNVSEMLAFLAGGKRLEAYTADIYAYCS